MEDKEGTGSEDRRPTPVRMAMEGQDPETAEEGGQEIRRFPDPWGGEDWVARISGRSASGILPLRVIDLMEISFSRADEPERPVRRAVCQGNSLAELEDEELLRLLDESRPYETPRGDKDKEVPPRRAPGNRSHQGRRG